MNQFLFFCFSLFASLAFGQQDDIEKVVNSTLEIISVDKGTEPNWEEFKDLFAEGATVVLRYRPQGAEEQKLLTWSVDDFIQRVGPSYAKNGFLEEALKTKVDEFNGVATVFQSYRAHYNDTDVYGVNTYQLVELNGDWKIISMTWAEETEESPLPKNLK